MTESRPSKQSSACGKYPLRFAVRRLLVRTRWPTKRWDWRAANDQRKDMACRNLLLRLEKAEHITLPPRQGKSPNGYRNRSPVSVPHRTES
jgi:hypothetical protein